MKNWIHIIIFSICLTQFSDAQVSPLGGSEFGYKGKINEVITELNTVSSATTVYLEVYNVPIWTLPYDAVDSAFTVGLVVTGGTSSATGRILKNDGSTLTLIDVSGIFEDNEDITDSSTGDASANGTATAVGPFHDDNTTNATIHSGYKAGETIAQWLPVVPLFADGEFYLTDAAAVGTANAVGLAYSASTDGNLISIVKSGVIRNDAWAWADNSPVWAYDGALTQTVPTTAGDSFKYMGFPLSADYLCLVAGGTVYTVPTP